jgi:hypothetical protein
MAMMAARVHIGDHSTGPERDRQRERSLLGTTL